MCKVLQIRMLLSLEVIGNSRVFHFSEVTCVFVCSYLICWSIFSKIGLLELRSSCCSLLLFIFLLILLVSFCKVEFQPFKFTCAGRLRLQRDVGDDSFSVSPLFLHGFSSHCVLVLFDTLVCLICYLTLLLSRVSGQARLRFYFTMIDVLFTICIRNALSEVFCNGETLPTLRSEGKQTSSSLKADFSHYF